MSDAEAPYLAEQLKKVFSENAGNAAAAGLATGAGLFGILGSAAFSTIGLLPIVGPLAVASAIVAGAGYLRQQQEARVIPLRIRSVLDQAFENLSADTRPDRRPLLNGLLASLLLRPSVPEPELLRLAASFVGRQGASREAAALLRRLEHYGLVGRTSSGEVRYAHQLVNDYVNQRLAEPEVRPTPAGGA